MRRRPSPHLVCVVMLAMALSPGCAYLQSSFFKAHVLSLWRNLGATGQQAVVLWAVRASLQQQQATPTPGTVPAERLGPLSGGSGTLLVTRNPSANRLLVAEEGVGKWQTFQPAGLDVRVAVNRIVLLPDGASILAATAFGIQKGSLTSGAGSVAAGTSGLFFLDLVCADVAARTCVATGVVPAESVAVELIAAEPI